MLTLLKTTVPWTVIDLPTLSMTAEEAAVKAIAGLNTWLEPGASNLALDGSSLFAAWTDRLTGRRFVPAGTAKPLIVTAGQSKALRMGFGGALTAAANGSLRAEDNANLLSATGYTLATLTRFPVAAANGGTEVSGTAYGNWIGSKINTSYFVMGTNNSAQTSVRHNLASGADLIVGTPRADDGAWHYHVASYDYAGKVLHLRKDGALFGSKTGVANDIATTPDGALQMVIGAAGATGTSGGMIGEIGGVFLIANRALHLSANAADLAALEARLASLRAQLASS
jgi:hypothetical protein